ncbi:MAG: type IV secretion system DNA-binding domain-containing protein [Gammaproteobacteria bacterium]
MANLTRGGQVWHHHLRMLSLVFGKTFWWVLAAWLTVISFTIPAYLDRWDNYIVIKFAACYLKSEILKGGDHVAPFEYPDGRIVDARVGTVANNPWVRDQVKRVGYEIGHAIFWPTVGLVIAIIVLFKIYYKTGSRLVKDEHMRGVSLVDENTLNTLVPKYRNPFTLANVRLPDKSWYQHLLVVGGTGTRKSRVLFELLDCIRQRGDRAIVHSSSPEFLSHYYRDGTDVLMNPLDARSVYWDPWAEITHEIDGIGMAEALIPPTQSDNPIWYLAPRSLVASMFGKVAKDPDIGHFLRMLVTSETAELKEYLKGTEAYGYLSKAEENEDRGMGQSIKTFATNAVKGFRLLQKPMGRDPFVIRDWIANDHDDACIFMSAQGAHTSLLRPLFTLWIHQAIEGILMLPDSYERRIWVIADELDTLHQFEAWPRFMSESRKKGGCAVSAFQSPSQLQQRWGIPGAKILTGGCATWMNLRLNEPSEAKWASEGIGQRERLERSENIGFGAHEIRDGVNLSENQKVALSILGSQIMNLDDGHGFLRVRGNFPIAEVEIPYKARREHHEQFVPVDMENTFWDSLKEEEIEEGTGDFVREVLDRG